MYIVTHGVHFTNPSLFKMTTQDIKYGYMSFVGMYVCICAIKQIFNLIFCVYQHPMFPIF